MALIQRIPLAPETTDQMLSIELDGNPYILRVLWNERFGYFSLSVHGAEDEPILTNIKMVKNYPLLGRFKDPRLPFGDLYFVQEKGVTPRPGYIDLAVNFGLYYYEADIVVSNGTARPAPAATMLGTSWDSGLTSWDTGSTLWDQ